MLGGTQHTKEYLSANYAYIDGLINGCKILALEYDPERNRPRGYRKNVKHILQANPNEWIRKNNRIDYRLYNKTCRSIIFG